MRKLLAAMVLLLLPLTCAAQGGLLKPKPKVEEGKGGQLLNSKEPEFRIAPVSPQAVPLVRMDAVKLNTDEAPFFRYLWFDNLVPADLENDYRSMLFILNATAQLGCDPYGAMSPREARPVRIHPRIMRVDLRYLSESIEGLKDNFSTWEKYAFDPKFNHLFTKDSFQLLNFPEGKEPKVLRKRVTPVKTNWRIVDQNKQFDQGGKKVWGRWEYDVEQKEETVEVSITALTDVDVIRFNGEHLDLEDYGNLQVLLQTQAPVIDAAYLAMRMGSSLQGEGSYKVIFGGTYYDHTGLRKLKKQKGQTDEDAIFARLGIINPDSKKRAVDIFDELRSDRRAAMFRSKIAGGSPRRIDWYPHLAAAPEDVPVVFITNDVGKREIETRQHAMRDLADAKFKAREWIFSRFNGLHCNALTKVSDGSLQDAAPQDVANDNTIPAEYGAEHPPELEPGVSCWACHAKFHGYQPFSNDVAKIRDKRGVIFGGTFQGVKNLNLDQILRLERQYKGNADDLLVTGRAAHARAVLFVTGGWPSSKTQTDVVQLAMLGATKLIRDYRYRVVDAQVACRELGFDVVLPKAEGFLESLLPPAKVKVAGEVSFEDVNVLGLLSGIEINRTDWAVLYSFAMVRSQQTLAEKLKSKR